MTPKTNLQYAVPSMPGESEAIRIEKRPSLHEQSHKAAADVHDFLSEKERYACNRATD